MLETVFSVTKTRASTHMETNYYVQNYPAKQKGVCVCVCVCVYV